MPVTVTEYGYDPEDPDGPFRRLSGADTIAPAAAGERSPWVEPDYRTVATEEELYDENGRYGRGPFRNWPGPPVAMPAGLLPDGQPHSHDEMDNARRIMGRPVRNAAEADACVVAYEAQQHLLREDLDLPRPHWIGSELQDTEETLAVLTELHRRIREARRQAG